jgi:bla regulator protein BlaR1
MICNFKGRDWVCKLLLAYLLIVPSLMAQVNSNGASVSSEMPDWQIEAGRKLAFEVSTIKPNTSDDSAHANFTLGPGDAYANTAGRFAAKNISLLDYIRFAYKLSDGQVQILLASAPKWIASERFDIEAKSDNADPTKNQMRLMMQTLLSDRFMLRAHFETKQLDTLAMVLATPGKLGPQLHPHPPADNTCSSVMESGDSSASELPHVCGALVNVGVPSAASRVRIGGRRIPLALLASHLGEMGGWHQPVVDATGLTGTFDLVLEWGSDSAAEPRDEGSKQTYMQESLKEQLGLKLERRKSPVDVLIIDHMEQHPTDN